MRLFRLLSLFCLCLAWCPRPARAAVRFVNAKATGARTGASWNNGFARVAEGVAAAAAGDEVWVAAGAYVENITMKNGVGLYGGFAGTETTRAQRNPAANATIIDGSQKGPVVFCNESIGAQTTVSGFILRNGSGLLALDKDNNPFTSGGGLCLFRASPEISQNVITGNAVYGGLGRGAAVYVKGASTARIVNNIIVSNGDPNQGDGAVYVEAENINCSPFIANNVIAGNRGHAVKSENATPTIANNLIHNNIGDGVFLFNNKAIADLTTIMVTGNTIVENRPKDESFPVEGVGVSALYNGTLKLSNNIIAWNGSGGLAHQFGFKIEAKNNCVYGNNHSNFRSNLATTPNPLLANGNKLENPRLASTPYNDFHIRHDSPCRNAGDAASAVNTPDMDGQPRVLGGVLDIGYDESDGATFHPGYNVVRVKPAGNDAADGKTWATAKKTIQAAATLAGLGGEVWVAGGRYNEAVSAPQSLLTYGGFAGSETDRGQRNWTSNVVTIDAGKAGSAYLIRGGSTAVAAFDGFTVQNSGSGLMTGGVSIASTPGGQISVRNNIVRGNTMGIASVHAAPDVADNIIEDNADDAVYLNSVDSAGRAATVTNNRIHKNRGSGVVLYNGSLYAANNQVTRNGSTDSDAGMSLDPGFSGVLALANNTVAATTGFGMYIRSGSGTLSNNIVAWNYYQGIWQWGNLNLTLKNNCVYGNVLRNYANFAANPTGSNGNISADPRFATAPYNDFHIRHDSPCRDAGDMLAVAPNSLDMDFQGRVQGAKVDIGADESNGQTYDPLLTIVRVNGATGSDAADGSTWPKAKKTVQAGIDAALGGEVWVTGGNYVHVGAAEYTNFLTLRPNIPVYGGFAGNETARDQRNFVTRETVLHGNHTGNVVMVPTGITSPTVLDGFTVTGSASWGTGIRVETNEVPALYVQNNVLHGNHNALFAYGANIRVVGNLFYYNTGDGVSLQAAPNPEVLNNIIYANGEDGLVLTECGGRVANNLIADNATSSDLRVGVVVSLNNASQAPRIQNNTIARNRGMAIHSTGPGAPVYVNNIVAWNGYGFRTDDQTPTLRNNCIYGNREYNTRGFATDPIGANGNIAKDPRFASAAYADYHIRPDSPCRDMGDNAVVLPTDADYDAPARIIGSKVDIGVDEQDGATYPSNYNVIHVSPNGADANDGSSWAQAKRTVSAALNGGQGVEIWVAAGAYANPSTDEYERYLQLHAHQSLYGGFKGTETERGQRDHQANQTILDGNGFGSGVVVFEGIATAPTVLDGFVIRRPSDYASGVRAEENTMAIIRNNLVRDCNTGILVRNGSAVITNNVVGNNANGISAGSGNASIRNNLVAFNSGKGISLDSEGSATVANNTVVGNTPPDYSGALYVDSTATPTVVNNIVAFNTSGVYGFDATFSLRNNNVYGNGENNYKYVNDPTGANGNISQDPGFVNANAGDFHLAAGSACIDRGDNAAVQAGDVDIDGQSRKAGTAVDMGADEFDAASPVSITDVRKALSAMGGLSALSAADKARLNVVNTGASQNRVDLHDAIRLLRTLLSHG